MNNFASENEEFIDNMLGLAKIYCVYDSKGEHFGTQPFVSGNRADAIRGFEKEANSGEKSMIGQYPADFSLFEIGTWNQRTGEIKMFVAKIALGTALEYKRKIEAPVER